MTRGRFPRGPGTISTAPDGGSVESGQWSVGAAETVDRSAEAKTARLARPPRRRWQADIPAANRPPSHATPEEAVTCKRRLVERTGALGKIPVETLCCIRAKCGHQELSLL